MKDFKKLLVMLLLVTALVFMAGCKTEKKSVVQKVKDGDTIKVGILQIVTHDALDAARKGFLEELEKAGFKDGDKIEVVYKNPEGDASSMGTMATNIVRECDVALGIATPTAVALQNATTKEQSDMPVLFTAVTDPVAASLVSSNEKPGKNVTGTNDMNPVAQQLALLEELFAGNEGKELKKLGIIYNVNEVNSGIQAELIETKAKAKGIEVEIKTVNDASEITSVTRTLVNDGCNAIYVPTDNLMASNMGSIKTAADEKNVVVLVGEAGQLADGGTLTYSIDYKKLGALTAKMLVKVLQGEDISNMAVQSLPEKDLAVKVNQEALANIGFTLPQSIKDRLGE